MNVKAIPLYVFVGVGILLLLGVLGYLNIVPVSKKPAVYQPTTKPQPNNFTPQTFQYDTKKAETLLTQYIKDNIKPELLPAKIKIKQGLSIEGKTENIEYEFGWYFTDTNGIIFSTNLHYAKDTNIINDQEIFILLPNSIMPEKTVNADLANSLIGKYLSSITKVISSSDCSSTTISSYCQVFNVDSDGKKGYGLLISARQQNSLFKTLFSCFAPKESPDYTKTESCITPQ